MKKTKKQIIELFRNEFSEFQRNYDLHVFISNKPEQLKFSKELIDKTRWKNVFSLIFKLNTLIPYDDSGETVEFVLKDNWSSDGSYIPLDEINIKTSSTYSDTILINSLWDLYQIHIKNVPFSERILKIKEYERKVA